MNKIIEILMERDGYDYEDAMSVLLDTKNMMDDCDDSEEAIEIFEEELGLEPDCIPHLMDL
ncbi:MAG: hypothetical protein SOR79_02050 [Blautia sp.]|uniref:hypothetical protein n=1 Tax=Blautia sp. TaxID=1955243 RepID=UPI002A75AD77|nr:hypothetical protein [Blautia sp.]MDY3015916.1 hypothetical protein [Blautia sp.]